MAFIRSTRCPGDKKRAFFFVFNADGSMLMQTGADEKSGLVIPCCLDEAWKAAALQNISFLGFFNQTACYSAGWTKEDADIPDRFEWVNPRVLLFRMDKDAWEVIGYARQINSCHENNRFCGRCGEKTELKPDEQARWCNSCRLAFYPKISPAIITAVTREDRILLARGVNFPNRQMFSVLAGFVDAQERLEDCVVREVYEETGIKVKNVTYFDSQPWPFPDSLMIGFTAEYESGRIRIDPAEIAEAAWFTADALPLVPKRPALSGALIQWFANRCNAAGAKGRCRV